MKLLIVGGTGLLGTHTATEALARGHRVTLLARGTQAPSLGDQARLVQGDVATLDDRALDEVLGGQDAVVYALGIDDRELHPRPAYPVFYQDHVTVCLRVVEAARRVGAAHVVVLGSYFTHFDHTRPEADLARVHPYIRSRCQQRDAVLGASGPGFSTTVLELPYIFGWLPGRVPPWTFLFSMLAGRGASSLFFTAGGTAAVTAHQVAVAALGAIEGGVQGAYPLGGVNLRWTDFARAYGRVSGHPQRLVGLPRWLFRTFGVLSSVADGLRGLERGLALGPFAALQYQDLFLDPVPSMAALGYLHEDYQKALDEVIAEWIRLSSR